MHMYGCQGPKVGFVGVTLPHRTQSPRFSPIFSLSSRVEPECSIRLPLPSHKLTFFHSLRQRSGWAGEQSQGVCGASEDWHLEPHMGGGCAGPDP